MSNEELNVLTQRYAKERRAHENDVQKLTSELKNVDASRDKLKQIIEHFRNRESEHACCKT
jgi:hypothetical protein